MACPEISYPQIGLISLLRQNLLHSCIYSKARHQTSCNTVKTVLVCCFCDCALHYHLNVAVLQMSEAGIVYKPDVSISVCTSSIEDDNAYTVVPYSSNDSNAHSLYLETSLNAVCGLRHPYYRYRVSQTTSSVFKLVSELPCLLLLLWPS